MLPDCVQMLLTKEEEAVKTALWLAEHGDYLKEVGEPPSLYTFLSCSVLEWRGACMDLPSTGQFEVPCPVTHSLLMPSHLTPQLPLTN